MLQDSKPSSLYWIRLKSFGPSAFGALRFRRWSGWRKGDWIPLANLVRLPSLKEIRCPDSPDQQCKLSGTNLFLIDSVASDSQFSSHHSVPAGFVDSTLRFRVPTARCLYIKLRDDSSTVDAVVLPVLPE